MAKKKLDDDIYNVADYATWANKEFGQNTAMMGCDDFMDWPRLQTGIFAVDYASGGGVPLYCGTQIGGPESGGKTTAALSAAATCQQVCYECGNFGEFCQCEEPDHRSVIWVAFENILEMSWAQDIGVDLKRFFPIRPASGHEGLHLVRKAVHAQDCGLVVVDSLAAVTPDAFLEDEAFDRNDMGLQARLLTKFANSLFQEINRNIRDRHKLAVIILNQIRFDLKKSFGNPEVNPGSNAFKHFWGMSFRFSKVALEEKHKKKYATDEREWVTRHMVKVNKIKCRAFTENAEFIRSKETVPELEIERGQVLDHDVVMKYAREHEVVTGSGPYILLPKYSQKVQAATLDEIKMLWRKRPDYYLQTQKAILDSQREMLNAQKTV